MTLNSGLMTQILIAVDLGSSLIKVVHTGLDGHPAPLALSPQLVESIGMAQMHEYGDTPSRSAWIEVAGQTYAAGDFAIDLAGRQYHELTKWDGLLPRILVILGLVAQRWNLRTGFVAQVGLLLPRDEVHPPNRDVQLAQIIEAAQQFQFRGQWVRCELTLKLSTEGAGLFAAQAVRLDKQGINPAQVDVPVVMAGERNTSMILYRAGKLNPALSSSDGPGFYGFADRLKQSLGVPVPLPDLIQAIAQGRDRLRTPGNQIVSLTEVGPQILADYAHAIQAHLRAKIPAGQVHVIAGGGALCLIWEQLAPWFESLDIPATYIGAELMSELTQMLARYPNEFQAIVYPALPARFADALGLYKAMSARLGSAHASRAGRVIMARRKSPPPPRTKAPNGTGLHQRIIFSYHASLNSSEGEVYQYLLRSPVWTTDQGKGMANDLILTRWLPYARLDRNSPLAQKAAQYSLRQLVRYIDELCRDFELEYPFSPQLAVPVSSVSPVSAPVSLSAVAPVIQPDPGYGRFELFEEGEVIDDNFTS
jgi:hypothetical protein